MKLYEGMRYLESVDHGVRHWKVRDCPEEIVPIAERTPTIIHAEENVQFTNLSCGYFMNVFTFNILTIC